MFLIFYKGIMVGQLSWLERHVDIVEVTGSNPVSTTENMNKTINITLPDGTILKKPAGITGMNIAEEISIGLAKQSILVEVNGELRDLSYPIPEDSTLKILKRTEQLLYAK